jgi:hypothetical protein
MGAGLESDPGRIVRALSQHLGDRLGARNLALKSLTVLS